MDEDIAWERFQESNKERVVKGDASISGKLDVLAQMLNEQGADTSRIAETVIPEIQGDRGAMDTQAQEMAAGGGMPPAGAPPAPEGDMPPEGAPTSANEADADGSVAPDIPPSKSPEASPDVQEPPAEMPPAPEEPPSDIPEAGPSEGGMPMADATPAGDEDAGAAPMPSVEEDDGFGTGGIDWSMFTPDGAFNDFMETLSDSVKEALDMGDTAKVVQITQVIEAMTALWRQSGLADGDMPDDASMPLADEAPANEATPDGVMAEDFHKSKGDAELDTGDEQMKRSEEEEVVEETEKSDCDSEAEKSDAVAGDELETGDGEALEASEGDTELGEGCEKSYGDEGEEPEEAEGSYDFDVKPPMVKSMAEMIEERRTMDAFDMTGAYEARKALDELMPPETVPAMKSLREMMGGAASEESAPAESAPEAQTVSIARSSRPPSSMSASGGYMQTDTLENLRKSLEVQVESADDADPLRRSLDRDWAKYMASKHSGGF